MELRHNKILISGGAGFIGTALTHRLVSDNEVVILDNFRRDAISRTTLLQHPNVTLLKGDVLDFECVMQAVKGCNVIIHLASVAGVATVMNNPITTMKVTLFGTYNVLEAALRQGGIERFVNFSTSEIFGPFAYHVKEEDPPILNQPGEPRWTYAVSKLAAEHLVFTYFRQYHLPTVLVRPFNIYGPHQVGEGAVHSFVTRAIEGDHLMVHDQGTQIRSWCYIDDITEAVMRMLVIPEAVGNTFHIGNPSTTGTIQQLAQIIIRIAGSTSQIKNTPGNGPDIQVRVPHVEKARRVLKFSPTVNLEDGLLRTIQWYRDVHPISL